MKKILAVLLIGALALTVLDGCSQRIGDFTVISTKNFDINAKYKKLEGRFSGSDSKIMILFIPFGVPNTKAAVENCLENSHGDLLTNASLDYNTWTAIVATGMAYVVTADVWVKASLSDLSDHSVELFQLTAKAEGLELMSLTNPMQKIKVEYLALH